MLIWVFHSVDPDQTDPLAADLGLANIVDPGQTDPLEN